MRDLATIGPDGREGAGLIRLDYSPAGNVAELHLHNHDDDRRVTVLLGQHNAMWLMANLGAFITDILLNPPRAAIGAMDLAGHPNAAQVLIEAGPHGQAVLKATNYTDREVAQVVLDHDIASALMAELGAFIATT